MATITLAELAGAVRRGDGVTEPAEPQAGLLERLRATAITLINRRCANVPDHVRNSAIVMLVQYWADQPGAAEGPRFQSAWHYSGAASVLSPFRQLRTGIDVETGGAADPEPAAEQAPVARLAWSDAPVATAAEILDGVTAEFAAGEDRVILTMPNRGSTGYAQIWLAPVEIVLSNWWLNGNPQGSQSLRMPYDVTVGGVLGRSWGSASLLSPLLSGLTIWIDKA